MILLDTHVVIWLMLSPELLSHRVREAILQARMAGERLACSPVSLYEITRAVRRKKLKLNSTAEELIAEIESRIDLVPLTAGIMVCAAELPEPFSSDPLDRIIAATAIAGDYTLITYDDRIREAGVCKVLR
jgi:PIN domain nuclease of toxin-antitoxin system